MSGAPIPIRAKAKYYVKDLEDWARFAGIQIGRPPVFPVNSVKAMRGALDRARRRQARALCDSCV